MANLEQVVYLATEVRNIAGGEDLSDPYQVAVALEKLADGLEILARELRSTPAASPEPQQEGR